MKNKRWILRPKKSDNIVDQLLINRNIDLKNKDRFLNPDFYRDIFDVEKLPSINTAVKRIKKAVDKNEKIGIFADYDADGIPGAAILTKLFELFNLRTEIYIPTRDEGYGLNEAGIRFLKEAGCSLMITVDLGIVNCEEVKLASNLNLDVIITDHHEIQKKKLPKDAVAIVHPKLEGSKYPNGNLSGGAVAWKLAWAVLKKLKGEKYLNYAKWWLDLAAITLVCDHMLLSGDGENIENRILVTYGLKILAKTKNVGLKSLYKIASIDPEIISIYTVGFQIGPRINAPGRMPRRFSESGSRLQSTSGDHATMSYYLLISKNKKEADEIAVRLDKINSKRQAKLNEILKKARQKVKLKGLDRKKIILICGENWPSGIIGLVAGKLLEEHSRPVIVFREEDKILHGSARSISEFNILKALTKSQEYLIKHGGHKVAAGVTLEKRHFSDLYDKLLDIADSAISEKDILPKIYVDAEINPKDITFQLFSVLEKFEPFGVGNPRPVFMVKNFELLSHRAVGKDKKHLKMVVKNKNKQFDCIGFGFGELSSKIKAGDLLEIVFSIDENIWNGRRSLQLKIIDLRKANIV